MKKLFLFAIIATFGVVASNAQGESDTGNFHWGLKAGVNISSVNGDDTDDVKSRTGLHIGAAANIGISELFSVQPEILYSMRGWKDGDFIIKTDYVDINAKADFKIAEGFSIQGGPVVSFNISATAEGNGNSGDIADIEQILLGALIGAQYEMPMGLFFNVHYDIGFTDVIDTNFDAKNNNLAFSVGFFIQ